MIIKVCGITNIDDARLARDTSVDLIGLNLVSGPRKITLESARAIVASLDDPVCAVALLRVAADASWLAEAEVLAEAGAGYVQLYGQVDAHALTLARRLGIGSIWVFHVPTGGDVNELSARYAAFGEVRPDFVLLDTSDPTRLGGTGNTIDWSALSASLGTCRSSLPPILLAGGLTATNVATAIAQVAPAGVDASSGVEASPGRKDGAKLRAFVNAARPSPQP